MLCLLISISFFFFFVPFCLFVFFNLNKTEFLILFGLKINHEELIMMMK